MSKLFFAVLVTGLGIILPVQAVMIDGFDGYELLQITNTQNGDAATQTHAAPVTSDFSNRTFDIVVDESNAGNTVEMHMGGNGRLDINNGSGTRTVSTVTWDSLVALDFTASGHDTIAFDLIEHDIPETYLTFGAIDATGTEGFFSWGELPDFFDVLGNTDTWGVKEFRWDDVNWFDTNGLLVNLDWTQISSFSMSIDSSTLLNGSDTSISFIETRGDLPPTPQNDPLPTPSPIVLIVFCLLLLQYKKYKRMN